MNPLAPNVGHGAATCDWLYNNGELESNLEIYQESNQNYK